jgi:2-polyprenyl-3-methyl-5-hydroxy-6-metoxy-1,4-benzoquinol methylase
MKAEKFWDWIAKSYDDEVGEQTVAFTRAHLTKNDSVLDYGCARGAYTAALAGDVGEIRGIDISAKMIQHARERVQGIRFEQATIFDVEGPYDVVLAYNVLHVAEDTERVVARISQLLSDGGRFISVTPCMKEQLSLRFVGALITGLRILRLRKFSVQDLKRTISGHLDIIQTESLSLHHVLIVARKKSSVV